MKSREEGAALALVIFFITFLSLWMSAVAFLTQTSTSAVNANSRLSEFRAEVTTGAFQQALSDLTDLALGQKGRYGMDLDGQRCDEEPAKLKINSFNTSFNGKPITVEVSCSQAPYSGFQFPLASFMLTGTGCPANSGCITGQDGGLNITNPSANDCVTPNLPRLQVTGGLLNASGAWKAVNCATLELQQAVGGSVPAIVMPDSTLEACPALSKFDVASCQCPTWYPQNGKDWCPTGNAFSDIDPNSSTTYNNAFLQNVAAGLGTPTAPATIIGSCGTNSNNAVSNAYSWGYSVDITPGVINATLLAQINALTTSTQCGNGSSPNTPAVWFRPGIYRFDLGNGSDVRKSTANTLRIGGVNVIAGTPTSTTSCNTNAPGAEFQFAGSSYFEVITGSFAICPNRVARGEVGVTFAAPSAIAGLSWSWTGSRLDPFMYLAQGNASSNAPVSFSASGMIYASGGWADLNIGGSTTMTFSNGAVFRGVTLRVNGSAQSSGALQPPPPYNGDRLVQLRFWDATNRRDLGLVQVIIKDYFSRKPGFGYKIVTWRTMW